MRKVKCWFRDFSQTLKGSYNTAWVSAPGKQERIHKPSGFHTSKAQDCIRWLFFILNQRPVSPDRIRTSIPRRRQKRWWHSLLREWEESIPQSHHRWTSKESFQKLIKWCIPSLSFNQAVQALTRKVGLAKRAGCPNKGQGRFMVFKK